MENLGKHIVTKQVCKYKNQKEQKSSLINDSLWRQYSLPVMSMNYEAKLSGLNSGFAASMMQPV